MCYDGQQTSLQPLFCVSIVLTVLCFCFNTCMLPCFDLLCTVHCFVYVIVGKFNKQIIKSIKRM